MKLHRLVLTNYRGITHREIEFPDHGVVVVSGRQRDRQVLDDRGARPAAGVQGPLDEEGSQAGQAHPRRCRFRGHRRNQHRPVPIRVPQAVPQEVRDRADHAGAAPRAAHRRRGPRPGACDARPRPSTPSCGRPSGCCRRRRRRRWTCRAATRCRARSTWPPAMPPTSGLSGTEPLLIDRIDAEYSRYFTATGRPTGEWAAATAALRGRRRRCGRSVPRRSPRSTTGCAGTPS